MEIQDELFTGERLETFIFNENTVEHLHRYALACDFAAGKRVLDIACGSGYGSALLAKRAAEVIGVDISEQTIARAAAKYQAPNISFMQGSADAIPLADHSVDLAVSFETIEHHDRHEEMMLALKRVLKPGGLLIISSPDKRNYSDVRNYRNPFHVKELYQDEFRQLMERHFNHAALLRQKLMYGSVLVPCSGEQADGAVDCYQGSFEELSSHDLEQHYFVGFASDSALPRIRASVFEGDWVLEKQFAQFRKVVTDEVTADVNEKVTGALRALQQEAIEQGIQTFRAGYEAHWSFRLAGQIQRYQRGLKRLFHA